MSQLREATVTVRAGNDSPSWLMRGDGVDVSVCTCRQAIYEPGNSSPILGPLDVTATVESGDEDWFTAYLTPTQTAALNTTTATRNLTWVMELIGNGSVSPPYIREVHRTLTVLPQKLPAS